MSNYSATPIAADIATRLAKIESYLAKYEHAPRLLAVSKQQSADILRQAYGLGQKAFGENYLQEALEKIDVLRDCDIEWHFIGPIQSNKCKNIAENFSWVQSLDRIKIANKLNSYCPSDKTLNVCVQVNIDDEDSKSGLTPEALNNFCQALQEFPSLKLRGIMAIPKANKTLSEQQQSFSKLRQLYLGLQNQYSGIDTLSMGMSQDYTLALDEGSTLIRIGTQLFGERPLKK